ncbi:MAG TPA: glyoxalase superfamily protein, partial [Flavisolibacter sp.]|nr:glyoxalase superfamily protein [Flavisolibacter sp.]
LTEHHGDCVPGARVYIEFSGVKDYHRILMNKDYMFNRPGCDEECMEIIDPFGNRLTFAEHKG